jgi:hypothetical protein
VRSGAELRRELIAQAARDLIARGVRARVFLPFAKASARVPHEDRLTGSPAAQVPAIDIVGTAGAADALDAGILFGLQEPISNCPEFVEPSPRIERECTQRLIHVIKRARSYQRAGDSRLIDCPRKRQHGQ